MQAYDLSPFVRSKCVFNSGLAIWLSASFLDKYGYWLIVTLLHWFLVNCHSPSSKEAVKYTFTNNKHPHHTAKEVILWTAF